ncbi:MAG: hypothetical protein WBD55_13620 [Dehalococcoidia bacterium]
MFCAALLLTSCGGGPPAKTPTALQPSPSVSAFVPSKGTDELPANDPVDLARRFLGVTDAPDQVVSPRPAVGDSATFRLVMLPADDTKPPKKRTISATLRAVSEHAYFFVEGNAAPDDAAVTDALRTFESKIWPPVTAAFGMPPSPGIDGDPKIVFLYADLGPVVAGYVNGADEYPCSVSPLSNEREIVYLDNEVPLGSSFYSHVLAHEFQHLIHERYDKGEEVWVNEGLSEFSAGLLGGGAVLYSDFLGQPDTQLTDWSLIAESGAHYGAASLFMSYLLEQTGAQPKALVSQPADGIAGIEAFLATTSERRSFEELVTDWALANQLDRPDGPYSYRKEEVSAAATTAVEHLGEDEGTVYDFAADYLKLRADDFPTPPIFTFQGDTEVPALAAQTDADGAFWWSGSADGIDSTLTRELDLTSVDSATLAYRAWFDIERWYDQAYVSLSSDGGGTWTALASEHTSTDDPLGISYGPAYGGRSGGGDGPRWVDERIDLSAYAGGRVLVRFEYVTDDGVSGPGLAIDDIAVPEIAFFDDAEEDAGGWERQGFRVVARPLQQRFALRLIKLGPAPVVEPIELNAQNRAQIDLSGLGDEYNSAIVVIVALTDGTSVPGHYRFDVRAATSAKEE